LGKPSRDQGIFEYAARHPEACRAVAYLDGKFIPESYTTASYHAVHTFTLTGPDGTMRSVRFHWEPVDGVQSAPHGAGGNFLRGRLQDRILNGHAEFVLRVQVAEDGDNLTDPTRPWSNRRPKIVMGHLKLIDVPDDQFHGCELLGFNPTRVLPGMGLSADPILAVRRDVYDRSHARRLAAAEAAAPGIGH
jgi:catalase